MWKIKSFFRQLKHLLYWLPVIWRDRDWDHDYLFIIMEHKLQTMLKFWKSGEHHSMPDRALRTQQQLMEAIGLLQRARNERAPCDKQLDQYFDVNWIDTQRTDRRYELWLETQQKQASEDWYRLWTLMYKYSKGWWD